MNAPLRQRMTLEQFLAWEAGQPEKWEFDGFQPVAMAGGTSEHSAIQRNLAIAVGGRLLGKPCQFYGSDLKVEVAGTVRYPDGFVVCTPLPRGTLVVHEPVVVFEVLSESTQGGDRTVKLREYQATPSIQHYVMLEQDRVAAMVVSRRGEDWLVQVLLDKDVLALPEVGVEFPLAELYAGVEVDEPTPGAG
jgi:Uma2 family endonuclease